MLSYRKIYFCIIRYAYVYIYTYSWYYDNIFYLITHHNNAFKDLIKIISEAVYLFEWLDAYPVLYGTDGKCHGDNCNSCVRQLGNTKTEIGMRLLEIEMSTANCTIHAWDKHLTKKTYYTQSKLKVPNHLLLLHWRCMNIIESATPMMTSSNGNIFIGHWWIPRTKASDAELWYFLWSAPA